MIALEWLDGGGRCTCIRIGADNEFALRNRT